MSSDTIIPSTSPENLKYEFTGETRTAPDGTTLHRIKAKVSFGVIVAGTLGGFIVSEANLSVSGNAWVSGDAQVSGDARVYGDAQVSGDAQVYGDARVSGDARVYGDAQVSGDAWVSGDARVFGSARVSGDARVVVKITCATRSDGYTFLVTPDKDNKIVIIAGCRYFTVADARKHWTETRGGTPLGEESLAIVDHLERIAKIRGWIKAPISQAAE